MSSNTGRFVPLAVEGARIAFHGLEDHRLTDEDIHPNGPPIVLLPDCGAKPLTQDVVASLPKSTTLVVPDGAWNQANRLILSMKYRKYVQLMSHSMGISFCVVAAH